MHFITLDLVKCALLVVIPMYFCECEHLIVNMIFCHKPDDYGRNLMKQTFSSRRNVMMTELG